MYWIHEKDKQRYAKKVLLQSPAAKSMYVIKGTGGHRHYGRGFFDSIGSILKNNAGKLISAAIPGVLDLGGKLLDKVAGSDGKIGQVGKAIKDNLGVVGQVLPSVVPLATSVIQNKLSDKGHDKLANTIGETSQNLLRSILERTQKGSGVKRLMEAKPKRKAKGSGVFAKFPLAGEQ